MKHINVFKVRTFLVIGLFGLASTALVFQSSAHADTIFFANLDGAQEVPPVITPASGFASLILNDLETELAISLTHDVIDPSAAHIHRGAVGISGPLAFNILPPDSPINVTWLLTPTDVAELFAGELYINVHSAVFPAGEIRGQILPVPEPASLFLLGAGLIGLGGMTRRSKLGGRA